MLYAQLNLSNYEEHPAIFISPMEDRDERLFSIIFLSPFSFRLHLDTHAYVPIKGPTADQIK